MNVAAFHTPAISEHDIQVALVELLHRSADPNCLWMAIPNGGDRHPVVAAKLRREGVRPGAGDLLFIHRGSVLFLEMKRRDGRMSIPQAAFAELATIAGADYRVAHSVEEAIGILKGYGIIKNVKVSA